jgi:Fe-Mn family superoxide dismutase
MTTNLLEHLRVERCSTDAKALPAPMALALAASFGSAENWRQEVVDRVDDEGTLPWLALVLLPEGSLVNVPASCDDDARRAGWPLLAIKMDTRDFDRIDWEAVYDGYRAAVHEASAGLGISPDELSDAVLVDTRRAGAYDDADDVIAGAQWRDPAHVATWGPGLADAGEVVVYCVFGHEVGQATAVRLRSMGVRARFLQGGIEAWREAGRPVSPKPAPERGQG